MAILDDDGPDAVDAALQAAIANAALEEVQVAADEQQLIRAHQRGAIDPAELLRRARELAEREVAGPGGRPIG